jgi:LacI family transcriptional regulator
MDHEIGRNGYFMMLRTTSDKDEVLRLARTWKLDGLILLWAPGEVSRVIARSVDTPTVFIDCYFEDDGVVYHNIGLQDRRGGYEMARYLLSMGHRKMLFLANDRIQPGVDLSRFEGCRDAFREEGLSLDNDSFMPISKDSGKREALYRNLSTEPLPYTALFFSADYYAAEALAFFQGRGLPVPDRISIAGFDDNHLSRITTPRLTTVGQDVYRKGQDAVGMLMSLIRGEAVEAADIRHPVRLVVRDSVGRV